MSRRRFFPSTPDLDEDENILERVCLPQLSSDEVPPTKARVTEYSNLGQRGQLPIESYGRDSSPNSPSSPISSDESNDSPMIGARPDASHEPERIHPASPPQASRLRPMLPLALHRLHPQGAGEGQYATDRPSFAQPRSHRAVHHSRPMLSDRRSHHPSQAARDPPPYGGREYVSVPMHPLPNTRPRRSPAPLDGSARWDRLRPPLWVGG